MTTSLKEPPQAQSQGTVPQALSNSCHLRDPSVTASRCRKPPREHRVLQQSVVWILTPATPLCLYPHAHHPQHSLLKSLPTRYIHQQVCTPTQAPNSPSGYLAHPSIPHSLQKSSRRLHPSMNLSRAFPGAHSGQADVGCASESLTEKSRLGPREAAEHADQGGCPLWLPTGTTERNSLCGAGGS